MSRKNEKAPELLTEKDVEKWIREFILAIRYTASEEEAFSFFRQLFSGQELFDISNRLALIDMLDQGIVQREIARRLGVSLCKITRGSSELKKPDSPLKRGLSTMKKIRIRGTVS
ncbi:MAG: Trp family transcriptional regulator [Spirochaetia bacterium]